MKPKICLWLCLAVISFPICAAAQKVEDCLMCHDSKDLTKTRDGKVVSLYVDAKKFSGSVHGSLSCVDCHTDLQNKDIPHEEKLAKVACGTCHGDEQKMHSESVHGKLVARGDVLAPRCKDCHGNHDILPVKDPNSAVAPGRIPYVCGKCHQEGTPVQQQREIHESNIIENYSESMHGAALLKKGLAVTATCISCHTSHQILPFTDPRSSIARRNIASTCTKCHTMIEQVHRKVIKGELWEKEQHVLPACVDCHQPHKVRKVFYDQGMAKADCLRCHERKDIKSAKDGRPLFVDDSELTHSKHVKQACSQCHLGVTPSRLRPCETITQKVDCSSCHPELVQQYQKSTHGQLFAKQDPNAPTCKECHGTHGISGEDGSRIADISDQCAGFVRSLSSSGTEGGGALHGQREGDRRAVHREHPRQGLAEERISGYGHVHELPHGSRRSAPRKSRVECQRQECPGDLRKMPQRHRGAI